MAAFVPAAKLGIVAGGGSLPGLLAAACEAEGRPYYLLGLNGFAEPHALGRVPDAWIGLAAAAHGFALLRNAGVSVVVMAGAVRLPPLSELRPDWQTAAFLARIAGRLLGDDGVMRAVVEEFVQEGFLVVGPDEILAGLVAEPGLMGRHEPDSQAKADIALGMRAAHDLGRRDVGQAVVVQLGHIVDQEDADGTAALVSRCADKQRLGPGGVLVKMKKPQQDRRVDLPVIGPETVKQAAAAGLRGIAIEAGGGLILGRDAVAEAADAAGLFVIGVRDDG